MLLLQLLLTVLLLFCRQQHFPLSRCVLQDGASGNLTSASMKVTILKEQKGRSKTFAGFFIDCEAVGRKFTKVKGTNKDYVCLF